MIGQWVESADLRCVQTLAGGFGVATGWSCTVSLCPVTSAPATPGRPHPARRRMPCRSPQPTSWPIPHPGGYWSTGFLHNRGQPQLVLLAHTCILLCMFSHFHSTGSQGHYALHTRLFHILTLTSYHKVTMPYILDHFTFLP